MKTPLQGRFFFETMRLLLGFSLLLLSWLQPMHILPWLSWHSEIIGCLALLAMAWEILYSAVRKRSSYPDVFVAPGVVVPFLLLSLVVLMQWGVGLIQFGGDAAVIVSYLGLCILGLSIGYTVSRQDPEVCTLLAYTLLTGAMCSAFIAMAQAFEVWDSAGWIHRAQYARRPGANLGQPNQLATLLLMGVVSAYYLYEYRKLSALLAIQLVVVLFVALAVTESRSGLLSFVVVGAWWLAKRQQIAVRISKWHLPLFGGLLLLLYKLWPVLMEQVFLFETSVNAFNHPAALNRWIIWPQLLEAVFFKPWFGWGFGQVAAAHNVVVHAYEKSEIYGYAHNIGLDFALGLGIPFAVVFMLLAGTWYWFRLIGTKSTTEWYCLAVITPVAVHSLLEYPFAYSYFLLPVMFAVGALEGLSGQKVAFTAGVKSMLALLSIATAIFVYSVREYIVVEDDFRIARLSTLRVGKVPENYQLPHIHLFTQLDALIRGWRVVPRPDMPSGELELLRTVALRFPMIATQNRYALALALNGQEAESMRQLRVMRAQQGAEVYLKIRSAWEDLKHEHPQLRNLQIP